MRTFDVHSLVIEVGQKEYTSGPTPSCIACKKKIELKEEYVCLRPDALVASRPKYPIYFCLSCWFDVTWTA